MSLVYAPVSVLSAAGAELIASMPTFPSSCFINSTGGLCTKAEALGAWPEQTHECEVLFLVGGLVVAALLLVAAMVALVVTALRQKPSVYCVETALFVPPARWRRTHEELLAFLRAQGTYTDESYAFLVKTLGRSATGDSTHWPPASQASLDGVTKAVMDRAFTQKEAEAVIFPIVQDIFEKTGLKPRDIDILIVNCSLFSPTPSLCAMICHRFGLRDDVRSYNLGGMGCSANVVAVDLARQLLENDRGARALVVSTEMITPNLYMGNEKSMLLQNTLFRCGGVALLLSSRGSDASRAKYKLLCTQRSQLSDDEAFGAVVEREDADGYRGVALSKQIVEVAGRAMKLNFSKLGWRILSTSELARTGFSMLLIMLIKRARKAGLTQAAVPKPYVPDFSSGIDHFCIHAGGRAVIDGVQKGLGLQDHHMEPSRQTLADWGNTSSSSIWYEAEWIERFGGLRRGQRVLQVAFGSGFKCNTAVWLALHVDDKKRGVPLKTAA